MRPSAADRPKVERDQDEREHKERAPEADDKAAVLGIDRRDLPRPVGAAATMAGKRASRGTGLGLSLRQRPRRPAARHATPCTLTATSAIQL